MPVGVLVMGPAMTADSYKQVTEKMFGHYPSTAADSAEGLIVHSAGQSEQGWYVYDIWESREAFGKFAQERIAPAVQEVAGAGVEMTPQFFDIETLVVAG